MTSDREETRAGLPSASVVARVIESVQSTDIAVLDLKWQGTRIRVEQLTGPVSLAAIGAAPAGAEFPGVSITAPLTGVYYGRPAPDQPAFVEIGSAITRGQVVGLIETMKLFNEIIAEVDGEVVEILVSEGDLVETNQSLMRVIPVGGEE